MWDVGGQDKVRARDRPPPPSRFQRRACASNERVSTGEPRRARSTRGFEKVPDFLFFASGVLTLARISLLATGFFIAVLAGGLALLAALAGVLCAKWIMLRGMRDVPT